MAVGRMGFQTGVFGDEPDKIMGCLSSDKALSYFEVNRLTGLHGTPLDDALLKLEELGYIQRKPWGGVQYYLKVIPAPSQEWYTIDEAARYLRVSRRTIYQLLQQGQLGSYRLGTGGHRRLKREDLDKVMHKKVGGDVYAINAVADPVLAELWNNEKDAEYDRL